MVWSEHAGQEEQLGAENAAWRDSGVPLGKARIDQ